MTQVVFEWGATTGYGNTTSMQNLSAGGGAQAVSAVLTGFAPRTQYHFRVTATNADGVDPNRNYPEHFRYDDEGSSSQISSATYRGPGPASYFPTGPYSESNVVDELNAVTAGRTRLWYLADL